jgi:hypothetical protein
MKNILLTTITVFAVFTASAQFRQGNIFAGTDFNFFSHSSQTDFGAKPQGKDTTFRFSVGPHIGAMVTKRIGMGIGGFYGKDYLNYYADKTEEYYNVDNTTLGFSFFIRAHKEINPNLAVYAHTEISFGTNTATEEGKRISYWGAMVTKYKNTMLKAFRNFTR